MSLAQSIIAGDRRALAKGITLIESSHQEDQISAHQLLDELAPYSGQSIRIGISGAPGVGKSTFIEAIGSELLKEKHLLCVLAVDPSSRYTGGSILGDKTRMLNLANHPNAYIRPSPSREILGGVARQTRETIILCEAAGFNLIIIETVGVGQSETVVADMSDLFLLLLQPAAGDELQGIKRGIMELADIIVVNKADGALTSAASQTAITTIQAIQYLKSRCQNWTVPVTQCSSLNRTGLDLVQSNIDQFIKQQKSSNAFSHRRKQQTLHTFEHEIIRQLHGTLQNKPNYEQFYNTIKTQVSNQSLSPKRAAHTLIHTLLD